MAQQYTEADPDFHRRQQSKRSFPPQFSPLPPVHTFCVFCVFRGCFVW